MKKVLITGAAGNIAYNLIFKVAAGEVFGSSTELHMVLLDIPPAAQKLEGVKMELEDCAYPLVSKITATVDQEEAFQGVNLVLFVGAFPRLKGMERKDLLEKNASIFKTQGELLNSGADSDVRVVVVGNPANTNCLILKQHAPRVPAHNFTALTRLDHNRALGQLAAKSGSRVSEVRNAIIWGNHSGTQYPDVSQATIGGKPASEVIADDQWISEQFVPVVQKRGAAVINARGASSAASAAQAIVDHARTWLSTGTAAGEIVSMAVPSDGSYGIPAGVIYSFPVTCSEGRYEIVQGLTRTEHDTKMMQATYSELLHEAETAELFLKQHKL